MTATAKLEEASLDLKVCAWWLTPERQCGKPAKVVYLDGSEHGRDPLPSCRTHDSEKRRQVAADDGWTVAELAAGVAA